MRAKTRQAVQARQRKRTRRDGPAQRKQNTAPAKKKPAAGFFYRHASVVRMAVIGVISVYASVMIVSHVLTLRIRKQEQAALIAEQQDLQAQVEDLEDEAEYVGSEEYIEQKAREVLGWVKEGEIIFKKAEDEE